MRENYNAKLYKQTDYSFKHTERYITKTYGSEWYLKNELILHISTRWGVSFL